ncbi:MAG: hypothetical protein QOE63_1060, partial [Acidimicrobiaceae bacterium]
QNMFVHTEGPTGTTIHDLEISNVTPRRDSSGNLVSPPKADAIIATATLSQIPTPFDIKGTLDLPKQDGDAPTALFEVQNGNTLPGLKVHVQNFISPDPTAGAIVPARTPAGNGKTTYEESAILRGDAFRLDADIPGVRKAGIRAVRAQDHTAIGTNAIAVGFADDFNVRAYVDLQPDPANRVLADVLIKDIPAEIDACMRGPWDGAGTRPAAFTGVNGTTGTWCDNAGVAAPGEDPIASNEGAIEIAQVPNSFDRKIDLDAYARLQFGGGSAVLAARVQVENVPQIIRVRLPGGNGATDVKVNAYSRVAAFPGYTLIADGIDKIQFHAATFDFAQADTPFTGALPYSPKANNTAPFPVLPQPADGREFIHAAVNVPESALEVRGQIGRDDGFPSSQLDSFVFSSKPCTNPGHPDFPRTPTNDGTKYTCVFAHFADSSDGVNPLSLHVEAVLADGYVARLRDAGISNIPHYLQIQIAKAETFVDPKHQRGWRRPCGAASGANADPGGDCMAPLLRFDQPDQSYLFGVAELAKATDLGVLESTLPSRPAPDFNAVPNETSWGAFSGSDPQATGIRAKVVDFDGGTVSNFDDDRIAGRVSLRLQIPNSLTVDTPQTFNTDLQTKNKDKVPVLGSKADDFRFHEAIRDNSGNVVDEIGELSAMVDLHDSGAQALITQPCAGPVTAYNAVDTSPPPCPEYTHGIQMPGEVGMTIYQRDNITNLAPKDGKDRIRSSSLIQADGRISIPVDIGARVIAGGAEVAKGIRLGDVEAAVKNIPAQTGGNDPHNPSFRLRAEIVKDQDRPVESTPTSPTPGTPDGTATTEKQYPDVFSFVATVDVKVNRVYVGFDFDPSFSDNPANGRHPARRLDAMIYMDGTKISADIGGFASVDPANQTPAEISAAVTANVNPLNFNVHSVWNFADRVHDLIDKFLSETIGSPGWLNKVIEWLIDPLISAVQAIMNAFPIQVRLRSQLELQFKLVHVSRFTFRDNLLHVFSHVDGSGHAEIGPINWFIDEFSGGIDFQMPSIDIPGWLDWLPGVPDKIDFPPVTLAGYAYAGGFGVGSFGLPIQLDFRECGDITQFIPYSAGLFNQVTVNAGTPNDKDFIVWFSDPRMGVDGILVRMLFGVGGTTAGNFLINLLAGPILCNIGPFSVDAGQFLALNEGATNEADYNPGNQATADFAGNPVPGQPVAAPPLPPNPAADPGPVFPTPISLPFVPILLVAPKGDPALYSGPAYVLGSSTTLGLCGVHTFNTLQVDGTINVAVTATSGVNTTGTGEDCPAGSEGTLELRANTMLVNGTINADAVSGDVAHFDASAPSPSYPTYRATGSSGGTNGGVGYDGSVKRAGARAYGEATVDTIVYPGGPGSSVPNGQTVPNITGSFNSAGAAGKGGGAIVLKADGQLTINGTVSANGGNGTTDFTGSACDSNPFEDPSNDTHSHAGFSDDVVTQVSDDPPYEHTGKIGSGGGAGGGIALQARKAITLGPTGHLHANGGNGGGGLVGAGGAGGGGAIKVLAPIANGISQSVLDPVVTAGTNGATTNGSIGPCPGIPAPSAPTNHDGDSPDLPPAESSVQQVNGAAVLYQPPVAQLRPYGPFWWGPSFTAHYTGAGGPEATTMVVCAVKMSTTPSGSYLASPDAGYLKSFMNARLPKSTVNGSGVTVHDGAQPTRGTPCGTNSSVAGPGSIVEVDRHSFTGDNWPDSATDTPSFTLDVSQGSGFYGLYTTAVRSTNPANADCYDGIGADDTDCVVEQLGTVDWVVGIDADAPTVTGVTAPDGSFPTQGAVKVTFTALDQATLSGLHDVECKVTRLGGPASTFSLCHNGDVLALPDGDGIYTIEVRAHDVAGNATPPGSYGSTAVYLDQGAPTASAALSGGVTNGSGWYRVGPDVVLSNWASAAGTPPPASRYVYRFDNGIETACAAGATCTAPTAGVLATGAHDVHYSAVNGAGVRYRDDADATTPSPMPIIGVQIDGDAPTVELATVPAAPDQTFGGNPYYGTAPYLVLSAIDQFGASGIGSQQIDIGDGNGFVNYDPALPPKAIAGVHNVCVTASDVAGNTSSTCKIVRVDGDPPTLTLTTSGGIVGGAGWYTTAPDVVAGSYDDHGGVSAVDHQFLTRVDNGFANNCDTSCTIPGGTFATGHHLVHANAADRFGNRSLEQEVDLRIDLQAPVIAPLLAPAAPNAQNGWYRTRPYLTLTATDPGAGSGVATISYSLNGILGTYSPYTVPVQVPTGGHTLCWTATDVAGNVTAPACQTLNVDTADPTTTLTPSAAPGVTGWYTNPITVTVGTNPDADSTVNPAFDADLSDLCNVLTPAANLKQPSGTCVALDGGPFVPVTGVLSLGEGIHTVRSFAVDVAGRRGPVAESIYKIDRSAPYVASRLVPPSPARNGWYRVKPLVVLRANDGEDGSGVTSLVYSIDNPTPTTAYLAPFEVGEGTHTVYWKASDIVGSRSGSFVVKVDLTPPKPVATNPSALIFIPLLGQTVKLNYQISDALGAGDAPSATLHAAVVLFDVTGNVVRRFDAGDVTVTKGVVKSGFVTWDGKDNSLLNILPLGIYYYRVALIDEAGNTAFSGESKPITIRLL